MAFKAVILLTRRADLSAQDFAAWWLGEHAALARQLPGLRGLRFNLVTAGGQGGEGAIDGISELWFDSQQAFDTARKIGPQVLAAARQRGVVTRGRGDTVYLGPALVSNEATVDRIVETVAEALNAVLPA